MTLKIFIDSEFTNFPPAEHHLISLVMAAETGEEFYVDVPFVLSDCSEFVRKTVIPLLGRIEQARCSMDELFCKIVDWLNLVR